MWGREDKVVLTVIMQSKRKPTQQQNLSPLDSFYPFQPILAENLSLYSYLSHFKI